MFIKIPASKLSLSKRKPVWGIGINDSNYLVKPVVNGVKAICPTYSVWSHMIERCYSSDHKIKHASYLGCYVCDEWLTFSVFAKWYDKNHIEGYALDKDIKIIGNKTYSPESCLFVPRAVNNLLTNCRDSAGDLPLGVISRYGKYEARIRIDGKKVYLGRLSSPNKAHGLYKTAKNNEINRKMGQFPELAEHLKQHLMK